jgi:hypothetical protein
MHECYQFRTAIAGLLRTTLPSRKCTRRLTVDTKETTFTPQGRNGQLTMRNNDIAGTRQKLMPFVNNSLIPIFAQGVGAQLWGSVNVTLASTGCARVMNAGACRVQAAC